MGDFQEANHASLIRLTPPRPIEQVQAATCSNGPRPRSAEPIEALAHFLAGLEERRQLLGDRNLVAGARIAAGAGLALLGREGAEAAQLDALSASERIGDLAENSVDDGLDVALIEMRIARGHALHEFRLDHRISPLETIPAFRRSSCPEMAVYINSKPQCLRSKPAVRRRAAPAEVSAEVVQSERRASYWPVRRNRAR